MNDSRAALMGFVVVVAVSFGGGFLLADHLNKREQVVQVAHPEIRAAPNDVALETAPSAKPKLPPPTKPRGGETVSVTELQVAGGEPVRVTPPGSDGTPECLTAEDFACPGALLRLDLIRTDDNQQYVAARGSDGREITGRLIPMVDVLVPRSNRASIDRYADGSTVIRYERRVFKRFWLGPAAMIQPAGDTSLGATVGGEW